MDEERLKRHDLSDEEWPLLDPLSPSSALRQGCRWADHRAMTDGVFFRTRSSAPWRDLPPVYRSCKTVYNRHRRWSLSGTWEDILAGPRAGCDVAEGEAWTVSADSIISRAHQHAAGARRAPACDDPTGGTE